MKGIRKIIVTSIITLTLYIPLAQSKCTKKDKEHSDKNVINCTYTQQDIERACKRLPNRYCKDTCFFCGCSKQDHTAHELQK